MSYMEQWAKEKLKLHVSVSAATKILMNGITALRVMKARLRRTKALWKMNILVAALELQ